MNKLKQIPEFLRFVMVGLFATGLHYGVYFVLQKFIQVNVAYTLGYVLSLVDKLYQTLIQSGQHRFLIIYRNQKSHFLHIILHYHKDSSKILLLFENKPH